MLTYKTSCIFFARLSVRSLIQKATFSSDKNQFFMQLPKEKIESTIEVIEKYSEKLEYKYLLQYQKTLEEEFTQLFAVLQSQKDENKEAFWVYCYYCATLLETFYKAYSQKGKEAEYSKLKGQIKNRLFKVKENDPIVPERFIDSLKNNFINSFRNLKNAPFHLSQIRDYVAYMNLCRLYWVFCRLTLTNAFSLAKELNLIAQLDAVLGTNTDVDKIISVMQAPNKVLNYLSVGFFLMRFVIDSGLLLRHTFFPSEAENKNETTAFERFKFELYKRHGNFANDLVWATVNFLTNFNHITHIPNPIAGALTAGFLGFDVGMTLYKCQLAKQEYLTKKAEYREEKKDYDAHKIPGLTDKERIAYLETLDKQLIELEINWQTKQGTFYFVAAGAALLMFGFSSALIFSPPGMVVASFFVCNLAIAMYLSAGVYSKYQEKSLRLEEAQVSGKELPGTLKEYQAASNDFIYTLGKNAIVPPLVIATFAIYWPAAVLLTVMCIGYEMFHAYNQHQSKEEKTPLALKELSQQDEIINPDGAACIAF